MWSRCCGSNGKTIFLQSIFSPLANASKDNYSSTHQLLVRFMYMYFFYFQVFCNIIDLACINAYILYKQCTAKQISRRQFILTMVEELCDTSAPQPVPADDHHHVQLNQGSANSLFQAACGLMQPNVRPDGRVHKMHYVRPDVAQCAA